MNPHCLSLALNIPLEHLLALPDAVGLVATLREDLEHLEPAQLHAC
jgi:hypothetical protein